MRILVNGREIVKEFIGEKNEYIEVPLREYRLWQIYKYTLLLIGAGYSFKLLIEGLDDLLMAFGIN